MKKIINIILVCIAILTIVGITAVVQAQQESEIATETAQKSINYFLPYPGILPGNSLYPLKMIRDRVVSYFITDPVKKAEFYLLMADKRINAGKFLADYRKYSLVEPTISKGQNYFDQSIELAAKTKKQGINIKNLTEQLNKASEKHEEVLGVILLEIPDDYKPGIRNSIERSKKTRSSVNSLPETNKENK